MKRLIEILFGFKTGLTAPELRPCKINRTYVSYNPERIAILKLTWPNSRPETVRKKLARIFLAFTGSYFEEQPDTAVVTQATRSLGEDMRQIGRGAARTALAKEKLQQMQFEKTWEQDGAYADDDVD